MSVKSLSKKKQGHDILLRAGENPFSTNKVTGHSLNVPIIGTCSPTALCGDTCYFARGPSTWSASLEKQHRLLNSINSDPVGTADSIASWARRLRLTFVRWNGGGDLVEQMVPCIDRVAVRLSDIPQWIVTRKPHLAATITQRPNVYVHVSVDAGSWGRLAQMRELAPPGLQWFWSYQCAPQELPQPWTAAVIFRDRYDRRGSPAVGGDCPLNDLEDIGGACKSCRRCFDGTAVATARRLATDRPIAVD